MLAFAALKPINPPQSGATPKELAVYKANKTKWDKAYSLASLLIVRPLIGTR